MKRFLLLSLLCISSTLAMAQTWTGAGADTNWNTTDNWNNNLVPTAADDAIIPTGFTVTLNVAGSVKSIDVQGTSVFEMNSNLTFTEPSVFGANSIINWTTGTLNGTTSTLINLGTINITSTANHFINGGTTLENEGTINFTGVGDLFINQSSVLNNPTGSTIDMQADGGNIQFNIGPAGVINNEGLLKKTTSSGEAVIFLPFTNNDGTIQVEEGILSFQGTGKNFIDGTYNVFADATMDWDTTINPSGTLEGTVVGDLNWNNTVNVPTGQTVFLNFLETDNFNWKGTLSGGGTLTNTNVLNFAGAGNFFINGGTTLDNQGTINFSGTNDLFVNQESILNNPTGSVIDMQADGGNVLFNIGPAGVINNEGLLKKTTSSGEAVIFLPFTNNDGTIQVEEGILSFQGTGKNFIDGTYNVFADATMDWDTTINPSGTLEGTVVGDLNWNNTVNVPTGQTVFLNFLETDNFNWKGTLSGGGTLTNTNVLNFAGTGNIFINGNTTLDNQGTIKFSGTNDLFVNQDSVLNNPTNGTIDMQADGGNVLFNIGPAGIINNEGLLKKTTSSGEAQIFLPITNNDGTIQVEEGILSFQGTGKNFIDGTYNVFVGATMDWDTTINPSGTLEGTLEGDLNWNNIVNVVDGTFAAINFSATDNFNWLGTLSGGGTLTNTNVLNFAGTGNIFINGNTTLDNQGTINFSGTNDLFVNQDSVLNNSTNAIIDMQADGGNILFNIGPTGVLNNAGLLKRTTTFGLAQIFIVLNNSGTIEVVSGELEHAGSNPFTNEETGIVKGIGIFDLPTVANYTNNGTFAPGLSPGTLSIQGDYTSTATSVLDVELDGLTPDTEYDVLAITGNNNIFEGTVNITLGFDADENDTFDVATTTGTITTQNLVSPIIVEQGGKRYTFGVTYPNDNTVRLTITQKLDIQVPDAVTQNITVQLDASGNASITTTQIDNGTTDNCTPTNELQFSLDITAFTCADLGDNTVMLTVTDNDTNSVSIPATVTVEDSIDPAINCPADFTVDSTGDYTLPDYFADTTVTSSDNCTVNSTVQTPIAGTVLPDGDYVIDFVVTDQSGNTNNCSFTLTVNDTTLGVNDFELSESSIQVYPNPVRNILTIKNVSQLQLENGQIIDVTGKVITTFDLKEMGLTKAISLESYSNGMYFVTINALEGSVTKRIVKQ